jgi:hypothetical protein
VTNLGKDAEDAFLLQPQGSSELYVKTLRGSFGWTWRPSIAAAADEE